MKRLLKFIVRLGVLAAVIALVIKVLDDDDNSPDPAPRPKPVTEPVIATMWVEPQGTVCPTSHPVKAKLSSKVFRAVGAPGYDSSKPDRCYVSEDAALADGFRAAKR